MKRTTLFTTIILATMMTMAGAGCAVEVGPSHSYGPSHEPVTYTAVADLEVNWTINGAGGPALCDYYGIEKWAVEVRGPETRDSFVDCYSTLWNTEADLHLISAGGYTITLRALDASGMQIMARSTSLNLHSNGLITEVSFALRPADF